MDGCFLVGSRCHFNSFNTWVAKLSRFITTRKQTISILSRVLYVRLSKTTSFYDWIISLGFLCCFHCTDPFYLAEHSNPISRGLHVIGTTGVFISLLTYHRYYIPNLILSLAVGTMLCELLAPLSHGFLEFLVMIIVFALCGRSSRSPWMLLFLGNGFAWTGHFFFEQSSPTFC